MHVDAADNATRDFADRARNVIGDPRSIDAPFESRTQHAQAKSFEISNECRNVLDPSARANEIRTSVVLEIRLHKKLAANRS